MPCAQYLSLVREFPRTTQQLEQQFFPSLRDSVTDERGHNSAGYLLFQLRRAHRHAQSAHGEVRGCLAICDDQFADEVRWHYDRQTVFRNLIPALGVCWFNRVHERAERFRELSETTLTGHQGPTLRVLNSPVQIGSVLYEIASTRKQRVAGA